MNQMKELFVALVGLAVSIVAPTAPAVASSRDDVLAGVSRCATIVNDRTWLDCFYGAAQPLRARLGLTPAPESQIRLSMPVSGTPTRPATQAYATAPPFQPTPEAQFGADSVSKQPSGTAMPARPLDTPSRIEARMVSYSFDSGGRFTATLSNGQVWHQNRADGPKANWKKPAGSYVITIRRGLLGDYNFTTDDGNGAYKVDRLR
ncbi:MAG TPA: hypothetical protein VG821_03640 [Rhizomicrobium sp.]|nr:hypothetical protein [Rhizomicrobium sp.]